MRRSRRVKIVATLGPASYAPEMIERLFEAGVDVFRINMSHSSFDVAKKVHAAIRSTEARFERPIGILADLQGPKFRVGRIGGERVALAQGSTFRFDTTDDEGSAQRVFLPHPQIFAAVEPGHTLLLDDGKIRMTVTGKTPSRIEAIVQVGGTLASRKGISLPDTVLPVGPLTDKDKADLDFALRLGVDWVALSFVQRGEDVKLARQIIGQAAAIMSKIEKPAAIADLDAVIAQSDGLMVARGDLGVEMPVERVPVLQKQITGKARAAGKPVVVATQMLESMISSPVPTRAEVSDVATAVFDGADAIMLSAESAVGQYPVEADPHHGPHRRRGGERSQLRRHRARDAHPAAGHRRRCHRRRRAHRRRHPQAGRHHLLHRHRIDGAAGWHASGRACPSSACRRWWRRGAGSPWPGACIACSPAIPRTRPPWCARPAASPSTRASRRPAKA